MSDDLNTPSSPAPEWPERPQLTLTIHSTGGTLPEDASSWLSYVDKTLDVLKMLAHDHEDEWTH